MIANWKIFLLVITLLNIFNYYEMRDILWSIIWLNIGGKSRKLTQFKKTVSVNESIFSRISMHYLIKYVEKCRDDFVFWLKLKRIFACVTSVLEITYFILKLCRDNIRLFYYFDGFLIIQVILTIIILRFQYEFNSRLNKYDRKRMKRK